MLLLMLSALSMSAQWSEQSEDAKTEEIRKNLALDYSMPDYTVKKIDDRKMGSHLANILPRQEKILYTLPEYIRGSYHDISVKNLCCCS